MNVQIWEIMAPAFFECLVLVGIHSYLGLHVIRRKVIFVDLALAQIAALGTTVGFLFGIMPQTTGAYWFSLLFTFVGAAVFSISRIKNEKIPQEAVIGLTYAIAASVAILVIDKAPHGAEHIKEIMTGSILWVEWSAIYKAAIVYSLVGIFHYFFRRQFILISENPGKAYDSGMNVKLWDFLFYITFGIVITHSVGTAGVLLVFVFLVVPAVASILITDVLWKQLIIGWGMGLLVSILGLYISYIADLPSGPTVVAFYGLMLVVVALVLYIFRAESRGMATLKIGFGIGVTLIIVMGFILLGSFFNSTDHEHHEMDSSVMRNNHDHSEEKANSEITDKLEYLDEITDIHELGVMAEKETEKYDRFRIYSRIAQLDKKLGIKLLLEMLKVCELPFHREEIIQTMRQVSGQNFGFDASHDYDYNKEALQKWQNWIDSQ